MSELRQIETKIYNEERIEELLEELGCWSISTEQNGKLFTAGLPDGDNSRSVQVKNNEYLSSSIRSRGITGSIFDIVSYIIYEAETQEQLLSCLNKSKYWLCNKLNYPEFIDDFYKETSDNTNSLPTYNKWLSKFKKKNTKSESKNDAIETDLFNKENIVPYYKWYIEGLNILTQKYFQVSIDVTTERIIFPVHNKDGELIGVKGRYFGSKQEVEDKYKYIYLMPCNKSIELFNLHRALPHIKRLKEVIILEGAKTTMYLTQWKYPNCVSIEGDALSPEQVKLLKELGIDIKYIFAFDKDKDIEYVKKEAAKLSGRMKYGIMDVKGLLKDKDSPTDRGKEVWDNLYNNHTYKIK